MSRLSLFRRVHFGPVKMDLSVIYIVALGAILMMRDFMDVYY